MALGSGWFPLRAEACYPNGVVVVQHPTQPNLFVRVIKKDLPMPGTP